VGIPIRARGCARRYKPTCGIVVSITDIRGAATIARDARAVLAFARHGWQPPAAGTREEAMFDLPMFTLVHVVISLVGIVAGLVAAGGMVAGARLDGWNALFLLTTVLTSVTGFFFPFTKVGPAHIVGMISLVVLAVCLFARYGKGLAGRWRGTYAWTAVLALYLNTFVLVVQVFTKTTVIAQLAPTQKEPPFAITQAVVVALFVWLGVAAVRGFRSAR
jgi:hypothetical protein